MEFFRFPSPILTPPTTGSIWEETDADLVINCGCYRSLRARHAATTIIRYAIAGEAASTELGSRTNVEGARNVTSTKITAFSHLGHRTYRAGNRNIDAWMRSSHISMKGWIQVRKKFVRHLICGIRRYSMRPPYVDVVLRRTLKLISGTRCSERIWGGKLNWLDFYSGSDAINQQLSELINDQQELNWFIVIQNLVLKWG